MSFKTNISDKSLEILGVRIFSEDKRWGDVLAYKRIKGSNATLQAFEMWAKTHQDEDIRYPLSEFLRTAEKYFDRKNYEKPDIAPLVSALAVLSDGQVVFNQKHSAELAQHLDRYTSLEIQEAFVEFMQYRDEFNMRFSAKDFSETAGQIIDARRARKSAMQNTERQLELFVTQEQAKVEEELAANPEPKKIPL